MKAQRRHDARIKASENMKHEVLPMVEDKMRALAQQHFASVIFDLNDAPLAERICAVLESMKLHLRDCQSLGHDLHDTAKGCCSYWRPQC